jgi:hypothetical protein
MIGQGGLEQRLRNIEAQAQDDATWIVARKSVWRKAKGFFSGSKSKTSKETNSNRSSEEPVVSHFSEDSSQDLKQTNQVEDPTTPS